MKIETVAVIGAGQMGTGIAQVLAEAGYKVKLCDRTPDIGDRAKAQIAKGLQRRVAQNKLPGSAASAALDAIEPALTKDGCRGADAAIEAATEAPTLKEEILASACRELPLHALLFSNTSSISITRLAACTRRPQRFAGLHFMNPVPKMKLVEVVKGLETSQETMDSAKALAQSLGKTVVVSGDRPGFIVNRVLIPMLNEACFALQEGVASMVDIDTAIQLGLNHPMGPLALSDLIGLDTVLAIAEVLHSDIGDDKYRPASLLRNLVAAGHLGKKTGRGFYRYDGGKKVNSDVLGD